MLQDKSPGPNPQTWCDGTDLSPVPTDRSKGWSGLIRYPGLGVRDSEARGCRARASAGISSGPFLLRAVASAASRSSCPSAAPGRLRTRQGEGDQLGAHAGSAAHPDEDELAALVHEIGRAHV